MKWTGSLGAPGSFVDSGSSSPVQDETSPSERHLFDQVSRLAESKGPFTELINNCA